MPPLSRMDRPNATSYYLKKNVVNSKIIPKFEKSFPLVCRACQDESIDV